MINEILKYMRKQKKLSQKELAKSLNIAQTTLSGYETIYSHPTYEMIEEIANKCNYDIIFRNRETKEELTKDNIERKKI